MTNLQATGAPVSLTCLRTGDGGPGLLVLPDLGGSIFYSRRIVATLDPSLPVWGAVLDVSAMPTDVARSIPAHVAMILDAVEAGVQQPFKAVLGHSYSGFSAYEFACQSVAKQRPVNRVFVLDTKVPWRLRSRRFRSLPLLGLECRRAVFTAARIWQDRLFGRDSEVLHAFGHSSINLAGIPPLLHPSIHDCYAALTSYRPSPAPKATAVTLFAAVGPNRLFEVDWANGWDTLVGDCVEVHRIVANHLDLVRSDFAIAPISQVINDTFSISKES